MCGNESTMRIEKMGNGFTFDAYTPGEKDKPGTHKKGVATSPHEVLAHVAAHLGAKGRRRGSKGLRVMGEAEPSSRVSVGRKGRRKAARKRVA